MTKKVIMEDLFSSDIRLFDLLVEAQKTNKVLEQFTISFPSETSLKSEDYGIFVGNAKDVLDKQTSTMDIYDTHIIVLITSKDSDYRKAKTQIDLGTKEVIRTIKESNLNHSGFKWIESSFDNNSKFGNKIRRLIISFKESYNWEASDYGIDLLDVLFEDVEVNK